MTRPALDEDRLKRLVSDLGAVVRRELPWFDGDAHDPGVALLELFAFLGEAITTHQNQVADDAHLESRRMWGLIVHNVLGRSPLVVTVDGSPWREVASLEDAGAGDAVYVAERGGPGSPTTVRFGDGQHGRRPADGASVGATYRDRGGATGLVATIPWPPDPPLALEVQARPGRITFAPARHGWFASLTRWFTRRG